MRRIFPSISLFAILLASCSTSATPTKAPTSQPTVTPTSTPPPSPFIILAYATDGIIADIIPYHQLTHINYSFLTPKADGTFNPINNSWKLKQIVATAHQHNVRVSISVGGWGWDQQFEELAANPESRTAFVQNLTAFINEYQLDGADIDWEYPDAGQSSQNFLALIRELRAAMPDKLLTTAVVSHGDDNGAGIPNESFELFDFVFEACGHGFRLKRRRHNRRKERIRWPADCLFKRRDAEDAEKKSGSVPTHHSVSTLCDLCDLCAFASLR